MREKIESTGRIIKEQIRLYEDRLEMRESGCVLSVGDGIARVFGLQGAMAGELLTFEDGGAGLALNLENDSVSVALLSDEKSVREGARVTRTGRMLSVPVGWNLLGRVVDALGRPIDDKGEIECDEEREIESDAPSIMQRTSVSVPLQTGIKAIDCMIPIGRGQRELIIGDRRTGKTEIAIDTILHQSDTGVICIYVAIGQKASSVAQTVRELEKGGALGYTVIVSASASSSASQQYVAPFSGCAMAEFFREQGKDVLIVYDDLSKHAVAYRTLSLLIRRPPGREAYPGDIFYLHARLLERAACVAPEFGGGSITSLPIIETKSSDVSAYIPTNVISITDGQIFLDSDLFLSGVMPAINPGISVSRVGGAAQVKAMRRVSGRVKLLYSQYRELLGFSQFGGDLDEDTRKRLELGARIVAVLQQGRREPVRVGCQVAILYAVTEGFLDKVAVGDIPAYERALYAYLTRRYEGLLTRIEEGFFEARDEEALREAIEGFGG